MAFLGNTLLTLLMLTGILLMFIVLLQRGRGGGLAGAFGGLGGQSAFGTKAGDVFTKITVVVAVIWVLLAACTGLVLRAEADKYKGADEPNPGINSTDPTDPANPDDVPPVDPDKTPADPIPDPDDDPKDPGEPTEPDPEPMDPDSTDPKPMEPEPGEPEPTDPEPTDPEPAEPTTTEPAPEAPQPTDPATPDEADDKPAGNE